MEIFAEDHVEIHGPFAIQKIRRDSDGYHIGEGKLRTIIDTHPNEDFYVMNGNRALIRCEKIERYLDQATAV